MREMKEKILKILLKVLIWVVRWMMVLCFVRYRIKYLVISWMFGWLGGVCIGNSELRVIDIEMVIKVMEVNEFNSGCFQVNRLEGLGQMIKDLYNLRSDQDSVV